MQRQEIPNNSPEQVEDYLVQALALTEKVAPPDDLREAFFAAAANLISSKQILMTQPQPVALPALDFTKRRH